MLNWNASRWLIAVVAGLVLAACAPSRGGSIPYAAAPMKAPDIARPMMLPQNYTIMTGDKLGITVFGADQLSRDYIVDQAGNIAFPLVGSVQISGKTPDAARAEISARLAQRYMRDPNVTVAVKESVNRNVTVDGSVNQPGSYPVPGDLTLIQAVAMARGTDKDANPRRVAVFRVVEGQRVAAAFDLTAIRRGKEPDPQIYAGDIIVVDGSSNSRFREILQTLPLLALFRPY